MAKYEIKLEALISNLKNVEKQINDIGKNTKIDLKLDTKNVSEWANLTKQVQKNGEVVSNQYKAIGKDYDIIINQTQKWNKVMIDVTSAQKRIRAEAEKEARVAEATAKKEENARNKNLNKIKEIQQKMNVLNLSEQKRVELEEKLNQIQAMDTGTLENLNEQGIALKTFNTELQQAQHGAKTFGEEMQGAFQKFAQWTVISTILYGTVNAIKDMIAQVRELDSQLVELQKVTDLEGDALDRYTDKAYDMAEAVGHTGTEMIDAATQFAKSGFDEETSLMLGQIALEYTNVADGELAVADAASFMIAQMKAFNIEAENSEHIIDAVNNVSNNYAVSSSDLANSIGKVSATMAASNTTYEQTLGLGN